MRGSAEQPQGLSEKERKYDRQLRLWASSGQDALESSHILLLNSGSGAVGVETLKNLVLPGPYHKYPQFSISYANYSSQVSVASPLLMRL